MEPSEKLRILACVNATWSISMSNRRTMLATWLQQSNINLDQRFMAQDLIGAIDNGEPFKNVESLVRGLLFRSYVVPPDLVAALIAKK